MVKIGDAPEIDRSTLKTASDLAPDLEIGQTLEDAKLGDDQVVIMSYSTDERTGDDGPYTLAVFTLEGGIVVHTSSKVVQERMDQIVAQNGDDCFPFLGRFVRVQSKRNPRNSYWTLR